MNDRERFLRIMQYEPVDRPPVMAFEPFETRAIERWRNEGLPSDRSPVEFLGMAELVHISVSLCPVPPFEETVVEEDDDYIVQTTGMGTTVRRRKEVPGTFYGHIDHPVKTRADWERYKARLDPDSPGRLPDDWGPDAILRLNESENPVGFCFFPFFFRFGFYAMGMERFLTAFHEEPDLIHDIFSHAGDFVLKRIRPFLDALQLDFAIFAEDLAGKNGPLISPRTYDEFWSPYQDPIIRMLKDHNVPIICQWSAGEFDVLLPDMIEHGFNCTWPLELVAGMDALQLRKRHGRVLRLAGNIPKEAVIAGPEAIDREISRLMPLVREGGFIPAMDDMAPIECPFSHYRHMIDRLQAIRLD